MTPYVALLRAINVGGRNMLPMKDLVAIFSAAGCGGVRPYIQSGNVVFEAGAALARRVPALVEKAIADRFGFAAPVLLRTADQMRAVAGGNPFLREGADPATLHVAFLAEEPDPARVATLDPDRSPPDRFIVRGREIYLCFPKGVGRTKLGNQYFDSRLGTASTVRNWRTVLKLLEMVSAQR